MVCSECLKRILLALSHISAEPAFILKEKMVNLIGAYFSLKNCTYSTNTGLLNERSCITNSAVSDATGGASLNREESLE